jgi:DNA-binding Lrp family transcriptional regulator
VPLAHGAATRLSAPGGHSGRANMKTLIVQIKCKLGEAYNVAAFMADNMAECGIYSISGAYDLLAIVNLEDDVDPGVFVTKRLHTVPGITETNTMIAFNAFTPSVKT